jgi:hypothetical protein
MLDCKYQIILLGSHELESQVLDAFYERIQELGLNKNMFNEIRVENFKNDFKSNTPSVCLFFGKAEPVSESVENIIQTLKDAASPIIPIVSDTSRCKQEIPESLSTINAFSLQGAEVAHLVSIMLESFRLLRSTRKIFISYKRDESSEAALQLFESLERYNFDVFLDTHSIKAGEQFQEELWHRMTDSDVVVLLNTPNFFGSQWTREEFEKANAMSIGLFQIMWPGVKHNREAELSLFFQLEQGDLLSDDTIDSSKMTLIANQIEAFRARCLRSRQQRIINECVQQANDNHKELVVDFDRRHSILYLKNKTNAIIPIVGVPQSPSFHAAHKFHEATKPDNNASKTYLLYDSLYIRENWIGHLDWLDDHLPVKILNIREANQWLPTI